MKKKLPVVTVAQVEEADHLAGLPLEATVALAEVAGALKDGLLAFASATGGRDNPDDGSRTDRGGRREARQGPGPERVGNWHGTTKGSVVLGGRLMSTERPRGRSRAGDEIGLDTWKAFSSADLLNSLVVERMLAGVATRRHADVAEPVGAELEERSKSMSKSAISRRFVAATTKAIGLIRPGIRGGSRPWKRGWSHAKEQPRRKPTARRYTPEEKAQAVRLVRQLRAELGTDHGTVSGSPASSATASSRCATGSTRPTSTRAGRGRRRRTPSGSSARAGEQGAEARQRDPESASAFFAAELDRPQK